MNDLLMYQGDEVNVKLPSGKTIIMREMNGDDEEQFSKIKNMQDGSFVYALLSAVIVEDKTIGRKPLAMEIREWKAKDIYYALFKVRVITHGYSFVFDNACENTQCSMFEKLQAYEVDTKEFDSDNMWANDYIPHKFGITAYPKGNDSQVELTLSSKKLVRFDIATGRHEEENSKVSQAEMSKSTMFTMRNLHIYHQETWVRVTHFGIFSAKDTKEIRTEINKVDKLFNPVSEFTCPSCQSKYQRDLLGNTDFFFPAEI